MKKILALASILWAFGATSYGDTKKIELGIIPPVQLGEKTDDVDGFRLGLIYAENNNVSGFDASLLVSKTTGEFNGFKYFGAYNQFDNGGNLKSVLGIVNNYKGDMHVKQVFNGVNIGENVTGARVASFVNYAEIMNGYDIGIVNFSNEMNGLQIGIFNYAGKLNGYQIGLINYAKNSSIFPILPIFNVGK